MKNKLRKIKTLILSLTAMASFLSGATSFAQTGNSDYSEILALLILHQEAHYPGIYWRSDYNPGPAPDKILGQPVFVQEGCGANIGIPEGSIYDHCYIFANHIDSNSGVPVWVIQPVAPEPGEWLANDYMVGWTPYEGPAGQGLWQGNVTLIVPIPAAIVENDLLEELVDEVLDSHSLPDFGEETEEDNEDGNCEDDYDGPCDDSDEGKGSGGDFDNHEDLEDVGNALEDLDLSQFGCRLVLGQSSHTTPVKQNLGLLLAATGLIFLRQRKKVRII